ncbi:ammonia-dependent NAD(+) synthetase [Vibrio sp. D431a]|uniref:ammonia-dependent NAD(+) synthetase n=1 Tax=Vibrio sp. D431a TaxID=2837388 RepID=UPI002555FC7E|nr:ammonia-dependent NAD(+) synthetase [Vibrio sp. D431a]
MKQEILKELGVKPMESFNPEEEVRGRIDFLKTYLQSSKRKVYVLGVSGGVDSTVAARLAQLAVNELKDEGYPCKFVAVRLPYGIQKDEDDAQSAIEFINADVVSVVNIKSATDELQNSSNITELFPATEAQLDFAKGNIKARERMIAQYYIANIADGLVIGTDHSAEAVTGFYTIHGDGACDVMPLSKLNKRQVRSIASFLGAPAHLSQKLATADLEDNQEHLLDEDALGVSYNAIDDYLEGKDVSIKDAEVIEHRFNTTRFKRRLPTSYCS